MCITSDTASTCDVSCDQKVVFVCFFVLKCEVQVFVLFTVDTVDSAQITNEWGRALEPC